MTTAATNPQSATLSHDWVRWSLAEVVVIADQLTGAYTVFDVPSCAVGEQVACRACGEPLTDSSALTDCTGEDDESPSP
jgi:hypothetical protein